MAWAEPIPTEFAGFIRAGPGGGAEETPVGTIFLAVADGGETRVRRLQWERRRGRNREFAAWMALDLLWRRLLGLGDPS